MMSSTQLERGRFFGSTLARRQLAEIVVSETAYPPSLVIPPHEHELASLCAVLDGAYDQRYGERSRACTPGMVICHPAGERHANAHRGRRVRLLCVELGHARLASLRDAARVLDGPAHFQGGELPRLGERLTRELRRDDGVSELAIEALVLELIVETSRAVAPPPSAPPRWLARAIEYLRAHYVAAPTVGDIAQAAGVHPAHLARVFRRHQGCTVGDYVRQLRIAAARAKLADSELPIGEVALQTGFSDQSHLSRQFRAATGQTPASYRRSCRAGR